MTEKYVPAKTLRELANRIAKLRDAAYARCDGNLNEYFDLNHAWAVLDTEAEEREKKGWEPASAQSVGS